MKKTVSLLTILAIGTIGNSMVFAQDEDVFDLFDDVVEVTTTDTGDFGFAEDDIVQAVDATQSTLTIAAPIVYDGADPIVEYDLTFAAAPRTDLEANDATDQIVTVACNFSAEELEGKAEIECDLGVGTDIQPAQTYYLTIFPKKNELLGSPSEEITFNYQETYDEVMVDGTIEDTPDTTHNAAPDMCTANISRSQDNDRVTVTWDALTTNGMIRLEARGEDESDFKTIGTTNISDEQFIFTPSQAGTFLIKLVPLDVNGNENGKACTQTMQLQDFTITQVNTQTGPKETLIIIGLIAVIGGYFLLKRKH